MEYPLVILKGYTVKIDIYCACCNLYCLYCLARIAFCGKIYPSWICRLPNNHLIKIWKLKVSVKENEVPTEKNSSRASIFATKASCISN